MLVTAELQHHDDLTVEALRATYWGSCAAFVARVEGVPAGCVGMTALNTAVAVLQRLFVATPYREKALLGRSPTR